MAASSLAYLFQEELYDFDTPLIAVLPRPWENYSDEEQSLLYKILTSVKINPGGVRVVIQPVLDLGVLNAARPERVLVFGSEGQDDIPYYQDTMAQGFRVVRADDLSQLDDQKKKNLWGALRQMFGV